MNFNYKLYQENIGVLGMQGTGKTTLVKRILDTMPSVPRIIISPINKVSWAGYAQPISELAELQNGGAWFWNGGNDAHTFDRICSIILSRFSNCLVIYDDIQEYVKKQHIPPSLNSVIQSGRNQGISNIFITPSPNLISNFILQSCQHIFSFRLLLESQIEWLEKNYFGTDSWLLLPADRRKKKPIIANLDILPKHSYLYRFYEDTQNQLVIEND